MPRFVQIDAHTLVNIDQVATIAFTPAAPEYDRLDFHCLTGDILSASGPRALALWDRLIRGGTPTPTAAELDRMCRELPADDGPPGRCPKCRAILTPCCVACGELFRGVADIEEARS